VRSPWHGLAQFRDRADAGRQLADRLAGTVGSEVDREVLVMALPRGGVPVGLEVARRLGAPLDVILVRKLGLPFQPELAMGALGEGGVRVLDADLVRRAGVTASELAEVERHERGELERRGHRYRLGRQPHPVAGRVVVIVDDGMATGSTARAACQVARAQGAAEVVLAVPVAPPDWETRLGDAADRYVSVVTPASFSAVGQAYEDFAATSDDEVIRCLRLAAQDDGPLTETVSPELGAVGPPMGHDLQMPVPGGTVAGHLTVPEGAAGLVVFAHGSGSSRHSPRNRYVASVLEEGGIATLLFDLLTPAEERDRRNVFDIDLLADRLLEVTRLVRARDDVGALPLGYFGASTGAAAALAAAARQPDTVAAVVSRGGRPDLAGPWLAKVTAPTLLLVGGQDHVVVELNRTALTQLGGGGAVEEVPGATHLFEEPGTLEAVAERARDWFALHFAPAGDTTPPP
jgi:putative phosphoribosyl transferase